MQETELSINYLVAEGPDELRKILDQLLQKSLDFKEFSHYILYRLGAQKSLIKVDFSKQPYQFWYCDTLGRPITNIVNETIARFVWDRAGEKELFLEQTGIELNE